MMMTLAVASLAAGVAGAGMSAAGAIQSANAQSKTASYQAAVASQNAKIANQNAEYATQAGQATAATQGLKNRAQQGAIMASQGALGMDVNSGSDLDVQTSQRETGLGDTSQTIHNAAMQAYGYQTQSTNFQTQSGLYGAEASNATALAPLTAGSDLLSGASSVGAKWAQFQNAGIFGNNSAVTPTTAPWNTGPGGLLAGPV